MTLINDNLEKIKTALLVNIKENLVESYPVEFGDYKTDRGDVCVKVYWSDTVRYQPRFPYCILTPQKDMSEGYDEITYTKIDGVLTKKIKTRSFLTVSIDVFDMGNEQNSKTSLQADNFAHKVARQLRKYFNGDSKLDWFSGNEYYPEQVSVIVNTDISSILDWSDTDTLFRYSFDIVLGWDDVQCTRADLATGALIKVADGEKTESFTIKIGKNKETTNGESR